MVKPTTPVEVPPILYRGGDDFHDHTPHGTLHLTATGVLAQSSNLGTMLMAERARRAAALRLPAQVRHGPVEWHRPAG